MENKDIQLNEEASLKAKKEFLIRNLKNIAFFLGLLSVVGGLAYILFTDLALANTAQWLFASIVCAFGSGACAMFSESNKHKKVLFYVLKAVGIVLAGLFIMVVVLYTNNIDKNAVMTTKGLKSYELADKLQFIKVVSIVLSSLGIVFQGGNIALNAIYGIEE